MPHFSFSDDITAHLQAYAKHRKTMTAVIELALTQFFAAEEENPARERILRQCILRHFALPTGFTFRSFWINLFMLSSRYPDYSSHEYWGPSVYLSTVEKTHFQVYGEITDEWKKEHSRSVAEAA